MLKWLYQEFDIGLETGYAWVQINDQDQLERCKLCMVWDRLIILKINESLKDVMIEESHNDYIQTLKPLTLEYHLISNLNILEIPQGHQLVLEDHFDKKLIHIEFEDSSLDWRRMVEMMIHCHQLHSTACNTFFQSIQFLLAFIILCHKIFNQSSHAGLFQLIKKSIDFLQLLLAQNQEDSKMNNTDFLAKLHFTLMELIEQLSLFRYHLENELEWHSATEPLFANITRAIYELLIHILRSNSKTVQQERNKEEIGLEKEGTIREKSFSITSDLESKKNIYNQEYSVVNKEDGENSDQIDSNQDQREDCNSNQLSTDNETILQNSLIHHQSNTLPSITTVPCLSCFSLLFLSRFSPSQTNKTSHHYDWIQTTLNRIHQNGQIFLTILKKCVTNQEASSPNSIHIKLINEIASCLSNLDEIKQMKVEDQNVPGADIGPEKCTWSLNHIGKMALQDQAEVDVDIGVKEGDEIGMKKLFCPLHQLKMIYFRSMTLILFSMQHLDLQTQLNASIHHVEMAWEYLKREVNEGRNGNQFEVINLSPLHINGSLPSLSSLQPLNIFIIQVSLIIRTCHIAEYYLNHILTHQPIHHQWKMENEKRSNIQEDGDLDWTMTEQKLANIVDEWHWLEDKTPDCIQCAHLIQSISLGLILAQWVDLIKKMSKLDKIKMKSSLGQKEPLEELDDHMIILLSISEFWLLVNDIFPLLRYLKESIGFKEGHLYHYNEYGKIEMSIKSIKINHPQYGQDSICYNISDKHHQEDGDGKEDREEQEEEQEKAGVKSEWIKNEINHLPDENRENSLLLEQAEDELETSNNDRRLNSRKHLHYSSPLPKESWIKTSPIASQLKNRVTVSLRPSTNKVVDSTTPNTDHIWHPKDASSIIYVNKPRRASLTLPPRKDKSSFGENVKHHEINEESKKDVEISSKILGSSSSHSVKKIHSNFSLLTNSKLQSNVEGEQQLIYAATLNQLIIGLTDSTDDLDYIKCFLKTYRSFTTPEELWFKMMEYYDTSPSTCSDSSKTYGENIKKISHIRFSITNIISKWLVISSIHMTQDIINYVGVFIEKKVKVDFPGLANMLLMRVYMVNSSRLNRASSSNGVETRNKFPEENNQYTDRLITPLLEEIDRSRCIGIERDDIGRNSRNLDNSKTSSSILANISKSSVLATTANTCSTLTNHLVPSAYKLMANSNILKDELYNMKRIADQLTLIEWKIFKLITHDELIDRFWNLKPYQSVQNVSKMIQRFNLVSNWVATNILSCEQLPLRVRTLHKFIKMTKYTFFELNNLNCAMSIISGINQSYVHRLKQTFAGINKKDQDILHTIMDKLSSNNSYQGYRKTLSAIKPPCIPYLGVYLTDLEFIHQGNKDTVHGLINFQKRRLFYGVLSKIEQYQLTGYEMIKPDVELMSLLTNLPHESEDKLYQLSILREPRQS